jgi:hypothetical protein
MLGANVINGIDLIVPVFKAIDFYGNANSPKHHLSHEGGAGQVCGPTMLFEAAGCNLYPHAHDGIG